MSSDPLHAVPFWRNAVSSDFTSQAAGLTTAEAQKRLTALGQNVVSTTMRRRLLHKIWQRLTEPLVAILIIAGFVSAVTGDLSSFVIITIIAIVRCFLFEAISIFLILCGHIKREITGNTEV